MMDMNTDLLQWFISLLIKRLLNRNKGTENNSKNKEFAEELRKPIIRKFEKEKVHSSFIDNIWGATLADMQLLRIQ